MANDRRKILPEEKPESSIDYVVFIPGTGTSGVWFVFTSVTVAIVLVLIIVWIA